MANNEEQERLLSGDDPWKAWIVTVLIAGAALGFAAGAVAGISHLGDRLEANRTAAFQKSQTSVVVKSVTVCPDSIVVIHAEDGRVFHGLCRKQCITIGQRVTIGFRPYGGHLSEMVIEDDQTDKVKSLE